MDFTLLFSRPNPGRLRIISSIKFGTIYLVNFPQLQVDGSITLKTSKRGVVFPSACSGAIQVPKYGR